MPENNVDEYMAGCPKEVQIKLSELRAAIREVALIYQTWFNVKHTRGRNLFLYCSD